MKWAPIPWYNATDQEIRQWARENLEGLPVEYVDLNTLQPHTPNTAMIEWERPGHPVTRFKKETLGSL